jgi:purine-nucleoside phosphorylase
VTPHNQAQPGDYAETVLLPGDPVRAEWIAKTFLTDPRQVNAVRNASGFTGTFNGKPVSVQATGMGQPSLAIYVHELIDVYGARTLIRVGTCGGLSPSVRLRDIVIAATASTDGGIDRDMFRPWQFSPIADYGLLRTAADIAGERGLAFHVGGIASTDVFYQPAGEDAYAPLIAHGVLAVEMETHALYTLAARYGVRALTLCAMTDSIVSGERLDPDARQSSLTDLANLALAVAVAV